METNNIFSSKKMPKTFLIIALLLFSPIANATSFLQNDAYKYAPFNTNRYEPETSSKYQSQERNIYSNNLYRSKRNPAYKNSNEAKSQKIPAWVINAANYPLYWDH